MTVTHPLTPAPRRGGPAVSHLVPTTTETSEVLAAAAAVADANSEADIPCMGSLSCERAGVITVVTEDDATLLCGMHAMTAVFTTQGLLALVKPDGM